MKQSLDMMMMAEGEYRTAHRYRTIPTDRVPLRHKRRQDDDRNGKGRAHKAAASREGNRGLRHPDDLSH